MNPEPREETPPSVFEKSLATEDNKSPISNMQLGNYRLLERIGEGGMGEVYIAEQKDPYYRQVAIKIIKQETLGSETVRQYIARFEAERQALALMNHPNIAKVIDGGSNPLLGPYIVMELCQGSPLLHYCRNKNLGLISRLELFLQLCDAIEHAHQKGIIHRDLKPSNVIVINNNGQPTVKVIDFGLAKALQPALRLTDKTLHTSSGTFIGTYKYTSPEQANARNDDIDTRSDIYSLGIILYELLTGSTPIDDNFLTSNSHSEILRFISEIDPPRPSSVLSPTSKSTIKEAGTTRRIQIALRNELDWITLKAIRKDRESRYQAVSAFADDIRNFLNNEPITARPPSQIYRLRKFAGKNRALVSALLTIFMAISLTAASTGVAYWHSQRSQRKAEESATREKTAADLATRRSTEAEVAKTNLQSANQKLQSANDLIRENLLKEANTALQSGIKAWSAGDYLAAIKHITQSIRLDPKKKVSQAWLYAILSAKANTPPFAPHIVIGGDSNTKKTLLSDDGSVLVVQSADNFVRVYSIAGILNSGLENAQRGQPFVLESSRYIFDVFRNKKDRNIFILAGEPPTQSSPPSISVWQYDGENPRKVSTYQPTTNFYTEPFFGPTGTWYVARGGNEYTNRLNLNYSIVDCVSGNVLQEFENIPSSNFFAISPDGKQIIAARNVALPLEGSELTQPASTPPEKADSINQSIIDNSINATLFEGQLYNMVDGSRVNIPWVDGVDRVGFDPLGRLTIREDVYDVKVPLTKKKQVTVTRAVPITVQKEQSYKVQVPTVVTLEDGSKITKFEEEVRTRTFNVQEMSYQTELRSVMVPDFSRFTTETYSRITPIYERDAQSLPYLSSVSQTYFYNRKGEVEESLPPGIQPLSSKLLQQISDTKTFTSKLYQIQSLPELNAVGIRTSGEFTILRIPSTPLLEGDWPIIPWASFPASPYEESHSQPKFHGKINTESDAIAIPTSDNCIHLYRLSTILPALPTPENPRNKCIQIHVRSAKPTERWMATLAESPKEKITLTEIRPDTVTVPQVLDLKTNLADIGEVFAHSDYQRIVLSNFFPPERPGFCIDGCGTATTANQTGIQLDSTGTPRINPTPASTSIPTPTEATPHTGDTPVADPSKPASPADTVEPEEKPDTDQVSNGDFSVLESSTEEKSANTATETDPNKVGKEIDVYQEYPMAYFSVLSFSDGKTLADKIPGILSAVTANSSIALVRNYNRLYFYDIEKLSWHKTHIQLNGEVTSCSYSQDGKLFAVGTKTGQAAWYDSETLTEIGNYQLEDEIVDFDFSSQGDYIAIQTSNYLPLPQNGESNSFHLIHLPTAQKSYSSQSSVQFRGFSPDGTKLLIQNQVIWEDSFAVLSTRTLETIIPPIYPPEASRGLDVHFVDNDLILVSEGRETWLYSCQFQAPISPHFIHPDMHSDAFFQPRCITIRNNSSVTLAFDANPQMRSWQVELPLRNYTEPSFEFDSQILPWITESFCHETFDTLNRNKKTASQMLKMIQSANTSSKWSQLSKWLIEPRKDEAPWPDYWKPNSIRALKNPLTENTPSPKQSNP